MVARTIKDALVELSLACEVICRAERCEMCPLKDICFEEYSIVDTVEKMTDASISRMLCMAEQITDGIKESEKTDADRRWEAEADYWNDRRCDLDESEV